MAWFCPIHRLQWLGLQRLFLGDTIQPTATLHHLPLHSEHKPSACALRPPHPVPVSSRPPILLLSTSPILLQPHWSPHTPKPPSSLHSISASQQSQPWPPSWKWKNPLFSPAAFLARHLITFPQVTLCRFFLISWQSLQAGLEPPRRPGKVSSKNCSLSYWINKATIETVRKYPCELEVGKYF